MSSQWHKLNNGNLPQAPEADKKQPARDLGQALRNLSNDSTGLPDVADNVEVHPDMINGQPGLRIRLKF